MKPMDVRQLVRHLKKIEQMLPPEGASMNKLRVGDALDHSLLASLTKFRIQMDDKQAQGYITEMWARVSDEQWAELEYVAGEIGIVWPYELHTQEQAYAMRKRLIQEHDEEPADIPL